MVPLTGLKPARRVVIHARGTCAAIGRAADRGVCHERVHVRRELERRQAALGRHPSVRHRRRELGIDRHGGHRGARTASAGGGLGELAGPDDRGCGGPWGGWFRHSVRGCVRFRVDRCTGGDRHRDHATRGEPGRRGAVVVVLPTVLAGRGSCDRAGRTPRARGRGGRPVRRDAGRAGVGGARRHHDRRECAGARRPAGRRRGRGRYRDSRGR